MFIHQEKVGADDSYDHIWSISIYRLFQSSPRRNYRKCSRDGQTLIYPDYLKVRWSLGIADKGRDRAIPAELDQEKSI